MKTRKVIEWTDDSRKSHRDIVWFGSYGLNDDGTAKKAYDENEYDSNARGNRTSTIDINYDEDLYAIVETLRQKLSVLKGELWNHVDFGIPLFDKSKSKGVIDSYIIRTILKTKGVREITSFSSNRSSYAYTCSFIAKTIYGNAEISI